MHIFYSERCTSFGMKDVHLSRINSSFYNFIIRICKNISLFCKNISLLYFAETVFYFLQRTIRTLKSLRTLRSLNSLSTLGIYKITKRAKRFVEKHNHLKNKVEKNKQYIKIFPYLWTLETNKKVTMNKYRSANPAWRGK